MDTMDDSDVLHNRRASVPSLDGFARVIVRPEVLFLLYIAAIGHAWILLSKMQVHWYDMDFSFYYTSALAMRKGLNPYTTNVMQLASRLGLHINGVPYGNDPPTFLLCFEPHGPKDFGAFEVGNNRIDRPLPTHCYPFFGC